MGDELKDMVARMLEHGGARGRNSLVAFATGLVLMAGTALSSEGVAVSAMGITALGFFGVIWVYGDGPPASPEDDVTENA